jgi:hypothetical protein
LELRRSATDRAADFAQDSDKFPQETVATLLSRTRKIVA